MEPSTIQQVLGWLEFAESYGDSLKEGRLLLAQSPEHEVEAQWMHYAVLRLERAAKQVEATLAEASLLPELSKFRKLEEQQLRDEWVAALTKLQDGIVEESGENGPLLRVLFVHRKLERLGKASAFTEDFEKEFDRRRASSYIQRMEKEPTCPYLSPLLAEVDAARQRLRDHEEQPALPEDEADVIRLEISREADRLLLRLQQARSLSEASFAEDSGRLAELRLDQKPRRKASKSIPPKAPAPPDEDGSAPADTASGGMDATAVASVAAEAEAPLS